MTRKRNQKQIAREVSAEYDKLAITSHANSAVALCVHAWKMAYCDTRLKGMPIAEARSRARQAFRLSMPALEGERNIRDFLACTTFGMLFSVIEPDEASKLFYAAQVARIVSGPAHAPAPGAPDPEPGPPPSDPSSGDPASSAPVVPAP